MPATEVTVLLWLLASCAGNILALYEQEKLDVLAEPPAAARDWQPELRFRLTDDAMQGVATRAVDAGLLDWKQKIQFKKGPITASALPKATVKSLTLKAGEDCGGCLAMDARLKGDATWKAGPLQGSLPFTARVSGTVELQLTQKGHTFRVTGRLAKVDKLKIRSSQAGQLDLSPYLKDWTDDALAKVPEFELGTFGGDDLPVRAVRLDGGGGVIEVQALTDVAGAKALGPAKAAPRGDWDLRIGADTALALARRAAFEQGPLPKYDVAIDPRTLEVHAQGFTMDVRLWKLAGRGWWRDYSVSGDMKLTRRKLVLRSREATEGDKSKGAGLADPLALLVEGRILDAVADGIHEAVPARQHTRVGGLSMTLQADDARGEDGAIVISGQVGD